MKVDRLLAIIMLMINKGRVTTAELAEYFEVSARTIMRDMEAINAAGVPIISHQGKNGGFSILDNYKVGKNFLTPDEISSLILALKGVNDSYEDKNISNIIEKVKGIVPDNKKAYLEQINNKIMIDFSPWGKYNPQNKKVNQIRKAIDDFNTISFKYTNRNGESVDRIVEPMTLILKLQSWYLYGYCRKREDYRVFKLSRIRELKTNCEVFIPKDKNIDEVPFEYQWMNTEGQNIRLKFSPKVVITVEDSFNEEDIEEILEDGSLIVRVNYPEDEWVYSMILSYGGEVEVLEPVHIRKIIRERAKKAFEINN